MAQAVISKTVLEPTTAQIKRFIMTGDFTQGSGIEVHVSLDLLNDDLTVNRTMNFELNASAGQKDHFVSDVVSAMSTIISDVETILGVTFV
jgi:hypothetical protein